MKRFLMAAFASLGLVACGGSSGTPGFTMTLASGTTTIAQGQNATTTVNVVRSGGFNDPISVITSNQAGLIAQGLIIPAGASSGVLTLNASPSLAQTTSSPLSLTVTAKAGTLPDQTAALSVSVRGASGGADTTFGSNGVVSGALDAGSSPQTGRIQADGKLVILAQVTGGKMQISRFKSDGSPDTGFGAAGSTIVDFGVPFNGNGKLTFQPDGKIIAAGLIGSSPTRDIGLVRLNTDGQPDTGFDTDGKQILDFGGNDVRPRQIVVVGDKLLVLSNSVTNDLTVARFKSDGSLDADFDTDGKLIVDLGGIDVPGAMAVQSDGKILIAGVSSTGVSPDIAHAFAVARVTDAGQPDTSFDTDGKQAIPVTVSSAAYYASANLTDLSVLSDGKIVLVGDATDLTSKTQKYAAVQLLANGQANSGFGTAGVVLVGGPNGDYGARTLIAPDGRIILVGNSGGVYSNGYQLYLVRLTAAGALDTTFGTGGRSYIYPWFAYDVLDTTLLSDGKILVLSYGYDNPTSKYTLSLTRYWP
jgi:uncharacterized delta-60 repeat protein